MATKSYDGLTPTERTRKQELGSAWIFRRALKDNQKYNSWEDITKDKKYAELAGPKGIYPEVTKGWLQNFYLQQAKMIKEFSNPQFTEFNREYGFMEYITKLVREKYGVSQKDTWDPADIWCIKNEKKVISDIKKIINNGGFETIEELNSYLRTLFKERIVVGVSLKKVSGKEARYVEVNTGSIEFEKKEEPIFKLNKLRVDLALKSGTMSPTAKGAEFWLDGEENGEKGIFQIDIAPSSSSKFTFVKFDPKFSLTKGARIGKAPAKEVRQLFKDYGVPISESALDYPTDYAQFLEREQEFVDLYKIIKSKSFIITGIQNEKEFSENMKMMFMNKEKGKPVTANSKCQQVAIFAALAKLNKKQIEKMGTKLVFLGAKKGGAEKGPHGKLY
jgi:hypothetical protein